MATDDMDLSDSEVLTAAIEAEDITRTEGTKGCDNLDRLCEMLGYRADYSTVLESFLADNSGCIEAIHAWIGENMSDEWRANLISYVPADPEEEDSDESQ